MRKNVDWVALQKLLHDELLDSDQIIKDRIRAYMSIIIGRLIHAMQSKSTDPRVMKSLQLQLEVLKSYKHIEMQREQWLNFLSKIELLLKVGMIIL